MILFGRIGRAHGVRGDVRFWPNNAGSSLLRTGRTVMVGPSPDVALAKKVQMLRFDAKGAIVHFDGVDDRDTASSLTGHNWYETRDEFPKAADGEVYVVDLIGLDVRTEEGQSHDCEERFVAGVATDVRVGRSKD